MTRTTIIQAALFSFAANGYAGASLKEIASTVGIKAPSIYAHFTSKEQLYDAVCAMSAQVHRDFYQQLLAETAQLSARERLRAILFGVPQFYAEYPQLIDFDLRAFIAGPEAKSFGGGLSMLNKEIAAAINDIVTTGQAAGELNCIDPASFTALYSCAMDGVFLQLKQLDHEHHLQELEIIWRGLSALFTPTSLSDGNS